MLIFLVLDTVFPYPALDASKIDGFGRLFEIIPPVPLATSVGSLPVNVAVPEFTTASVPCPERDITAMLTLPCVAACIGDGFVAVPRAINLLELSKPVSLGECEVNAVPRPSGTLLISGLVSSLSTTSLRPKYPNVLVGEIILTLRARRLFEDERLHRR